MDKKQNKAMLLGTLGAALGIRQMAMTMIMPFLSTYCRQLDNYTPVLAGIALGAFGLMQALFQIPYGIWSDKKGNKLVMCVGLMQVIIGLIVAFFATDIYVLIFARALQGSGAVIAVGYSWISASFTDEKSRMNALSILSVIVGGAASISFALGTFVNMFISVKEMFLYSAGLIFIAWILIILFLKDKKKTKSDKEISSKEAMKILLKNKCFVGLNIAGFINNFILTGVFFAIPQCLESITGIDGMWKVFMPSVIIAIVLMELVANKLNERSSITVLIISFIVTAAGMLFYLNGSWFIMILIGTILFMIGYIFMFTLIANLSNSILKDEYRGCGNGIINSIQYFGSFVGSVITAKIWEVNQNLSFIVIAVLALIGASIIKRYVKKENFNAR